MGEDEARRIMDMSKEDEDLRKALRMSEEEDAKRKREQESANQTALFDDNLNL
jgi:epsin